MTDLTLHLYTPSNYYITGEQISMSLYTSSVSGILPIDRVANSFQVNFNDYTASNYICTYDNNDFTYAYITPLETAFIDISANIDGTIYSRSFDFLRIDKTKNTTDLQVSRPSPKTIVQLPHNNIYVPTNEWSVSQSFNRVIDQLYDNFEYLLESCKTYKPAPTKRAGWGRFLPYSPEYCVETNQGTDESLNGLVAWFTLDSTTQNYNGIIKEKGAWVTTPPLHTPTTPSYTTGKYGDCGDFKDNKYIRFPTPINLESSDVTITWWEKLDPASPPPIARFQIGYTPFSGIQSYISLTNHSTFMWRLSSDSSSAISQYNTTNVFIDDGEWHHYAVSKERANIKIYIDGQLTKNSTFIYNVPPDYNTPIPLPASHEQDIKLYAIARADSSGATSNIFQGQIDEVTLWNRPLTIDEIQDIKNKTYFTYTKSLPIYGVIQGTNTIVKLQDVSEENYSLGTSLIPTVSTISNTYLATEINKAYCSNLQGLGIPLLSSQTIYDNLNLATENLSATNIPFTHTVIDYPLKDSRGNTIIPEESNFLLIKSCYNQYRLIRTYTLQREYIPQEFSYTPLVLDWHLNDQFLTTTLVTGGFDQDIHDIYVQENTLYVARDSFIDRYDLQYAYKEFDFTSESLDVSEQYTKATSVTEIDKRMYVLDSIRHQVKMYEKDNTTNIIYNIGDWGIIGGKDSRQGFYKPTQIFNHKEFIYICDSGNGVVKKYTFQGNWVKTFDCSITDPKKEQILSACCDINDTLHVLTSDHRVIQVSQNNNILKNTSFKFETSPVKIIATSNKDMLYICCERSITRLTIEHQITNTFAKLNQDTTLQKYKSITCDENNTLYVTDGKYIEKYLDVIDTLAIRTSDTDKLFWSRADIYIKPEEFVDDWVYNKSLRRLGENLSILWTTLENKFIPLSDDTFMVASVDERDLGIVNGLPIKLADLNVVGLNEVVTPEVLNRSIDDIQQNTFYILQMITNQLSVNKLGIPINYKLRTPVVSRCCWDWQSRVSGKCCTPWYWVAEDITWIHAENTNNVVLLSGAQFSVPTNNVLPIASIDPDITISFWVSSIEFAAQSPVNLLGFENVSFDTPGINFFLSGSELGINLNGYIYTTQNNTFNKTLTGFTNFVFRKQQNTFSLLVNGAVELSESNTPGRLSLLPTLLDTNTSPTINKFIFGDTKFTPDEKFVGAIYDVRIFDNAIENSNILEIINRKHSWELSSDLQTANKAHWYCNSKYTWLDYSGNNVHANQVTGNSIVFNDQVGDCCSLNQIPFIDINNIILT